MKTFLGVLFLLIPQLIFAQYTIKGTVTDSETGEKIANVHISNAEENGLSDARGEFSIRGTQGENVIEIRHVSYQKEQIKVSLSPEKPAAELKIFLKLKISEFEETVVTASRNPNANRNTPYSVSVLGKTQIGFSAGLNIDDILQQAPGIKTFRPIGIFQHSPSLSLSGSGNVPGRTLIMLDGIPLNKADNGNVNLNRISVEQIERIEILHNGSAGIYGSNAMNGVINIISKTPVESGTEIHAGIETASFGTYSGNIRIGGLTKNKKFSFQATGRYRQSEGYISTPDSLQESYIQYIPTWMEEYAGELSGTYRFTENHSISFTYNYFDDVRSTGEKIRESQGSVNEHDTQHARLNYSGRHKQTNWNTNFYYLREDYFRTMESLRNDNYNLTNVNSLREDAGASAHITQKYLTQSSITAGADYRRGRVHGTDDYTNSGDIVTNRGILNEYTMFIQNQNSFRKKWHLSQGIVFAQSRINDASFTIENPTSATGFMSEYTGEFAPHNKQKIIGSVAAKYRISSVLDIAAGYNPGFRSPTLDDMTRSGLMHLGFKIANPELQPEWTDNFYTAADILLPKTQISLNASYGIGQNFMHYIGTGDSIFGGKRPVVRLENLTEVRTKSLIVDIKQKTAENLFIYANYTYNETRISRFEEMPQLEEKLLTYNPLHTINMGLNGKTKIVDFGINTHYRSKQFTDDTNSQSIAAFGTMDILLRKHIFPNFTVEVSAQNIFDKRYLVFYTQESVGRFLSAKISYTFKKIRKK